MISVFNTAHVTPETVLVELFICLAVPKTAGIRRNLVSKYNRSIRKTSEFQLEVNEFDSELEKICLKNRIHPECKLFDSINFRGSRKLKCDRMIGIDQRVMKVVIFIGKFDSGLVKNNSFFNTVTLTKRIPPYYF